MNLKEAEKLGIITEKKVIAYFITCQKCKGKWEIRDVTQMPKACIHCKKDPYSGRKPKGRPKKKN